MKLTNFLIISTILVGLLKSGMTAVIGQPAVVNIAPVSGGIIEGSVGRQARQVNAKIPGEISVYVYDPPVSGSVITGCGGKRPQGAAISGSHINGCLIENSGPISGGTVRGLEGAEKDLARGVHNSGPISGGDIQGNVGRVARSTLSDIRPGVALNSHPVNGGIVKGDLGRTA